MKHKFFLPAAIFVGCTLAGINLSGCKSTENAPELIVVDLSLAYPVMDLKLSDIADISYIPLPGNDSAKLLSLASTLPNNIYIGEEQIFVGDFAPYRKDGEWHRFSPQDGRLLRYDSKGRYLGTIFRSKDEGESISFGMNAPYAVFPEKEQIYAFSAYGKFIRGFNYNGGIISTGKNIGTEYRECIALGDTIALMNLHPDIEIMAHNVCTGESAHHRTHTFAKPYDSKGPSTAKHITITETGAYIITPRTDTVYHLNRNLEIVPAFLNIRHTEDADNLACPLVETSDYILLCNIQDLKSAREQRFKNANYIYMKTENQIYRLPWEGESVLNENYTTLTPNTLAIVLPISELKEKYNLLPDEFQHIADAASEDDGTVLIVLRFGK